MNDNKFLQPVKVAVIDDNPEFGQGLEFLLAKEGVEVHTANDGPAGLEMVKHLLPDIVLLDIVMPGMNGFEVCKKIRETPELINSVIVMFSGIKTDTDHMSEGLEAGADDYITRPIPNRELLARLRVHIRLKRTEKALNQSEERFKALHNASFGGITIHDKGLILECNQGLSEITGYSYDELIGMDGLLLIAPASRDMVMNNILAGYEKPYEAVGLRKNGELYPVRLEARNVPYKGKTVRTTEFRDVTEEKKTQEALQRIEWMLSKKVEAEKSEQASLYGDLTVLNRDRLILDSVGSKLLREIANDYLNLLETSSAVYEKNGDYAFGIFSSGWCRFMDQASRELCNTDDNAEALKCGRWLCHESCWKEASLPAMESGRSVDIECQGGLHLYALPIFAGGEVIGAINFGYGDPPQDKDKLSELSQKYKVPLDELRKIAREYESRPPYIIDMAKDRLEASANLIGEIVSRKSTEKEILKLNEQLEQKVEEKTKELKERVAELERFHDATIQREFRIKELRDEIEQLKREQKT